MNEMKKINAWREIAKEIDLDLKAEKDLAQTLRLVATEMQDFAEVPMPANYEENLIRSLRKKLPLEQTRVGFWESLAARIRLPEFNLQPSIHQWAAAGTFAVITVFVGHSINGSARPAVDSIGESILLTTAQAADSDSVDSWLNSISDSSRYAASRHIASLAQEMTREMNTTEQQTVINSFVGEDI
jgi:hypothetical protein